MGVWRGRWEWVRGATGPGQSAYNPETKPPTKGMNPSGRTAGDPTIKEEVGVSVVAQHMEGRECLPNGAESSTTPPPSMGP